MLKSIFYARFHQEQGPIVLHQVPEGSVTLQTSAPANQAALFDFQSISDYIIPRREFCDRLLTVCCNHHRVIGFPVCITDDKKYDRNDFIFNFCLVLHEDAQWSSYASMVKKLARLFTNLEEQDGFLSKEEDKDSLMGPGEAGRGNRSRVYALCEMIMEDLNNYCECMIPIDESNTLNLKIFPIRPPPASVYSWHVPLSVVNFSTLQTSSWDLTVQRIIPHIDGIHSVAVIAALADTDLSLTKRAIAHLVYHGCILLIDIFSFGAIYAPTADIGAFMIDDAMQDECRRYVASPVSTFGKDVSQMRALTSAWATRDETLSLQQAQLPSRMQIQETYASLRQGQSLRDWCISRASSLAGIDVRRLITFGIIKGFLYRVHKYAMALRPADLDVNVDDPIAMQRQHERAWRKAAMSSGWRTPREESESKTKSWLQQGDGDAPSQSAQTLRPRSAPGTPGGLELQLARYTNGLHCIDEVCTELGLVERDVVSAMRVLGDVVFLHR